MSLRRRTRCYGGAPLSAGMSMQEYLVALLDELASKPTVEEVLGRVGGRVGLVEAAETLRAERDDR